jgi:hypothetical protein
MKHAKLVQRFERGLGFFVEPPLQSAILSKQWFVDLFNWVHVWGHWPVIVAVALWLYRLHLEQYRLTRNSFLISGAIGLVIFTPFPVAPPKLADMGLVDTVMERSNFYHLLQPPSLTNQFAAVLSLHFGWNLLIGIALFRESRHRLGRLFGVRLPMLMLAAVVLPENHYLVDTVAGGTIVLIGLRTVFVIQSRRSVEWRLVARVVDASRRHLGWLARPRRWLPHGVSESVLGCEAQRVELHRVAMASLAELPVSRAPADRTRVQCARPMLPRCDQIFIEK